MNICVPAPTNSHAKRALGPISLIFIVLLLSWQLKLTVRSITNRRGQQQDAARTAYLQAFGIFVLRFSNRDVLLNLEGVAAEIERTILMRISK